MLYTVVIAVVWPSAAPLHDDFANRLLDRYAIVAFREMGFWLWPVSLATFDCGYHGPQVEGCRVVIGC
jgi:hypothetical protein